MTSPPVFDPESLTLAKVSERLIQRFGGIRPMANKLEVPVTTVQGWKKRGAIPATRINDLRAAAVRHGIKLEESELDAVSRSDERHPEMTRAAPVKAPPLAPVPLSPTEPVPVNVPLAIPPVMPPVTLAVAPFEVAEPTPSPSPSPFPSPTPLSSSPLPGPAPTPPLVQAAPSNPAPAIAAPRPTRPGAEAMAPMRPRPGGPPASAPATGTWLGLSAVRLSIAAAAVSLLGAAVTVLESGPVPSGSGTPVAADRRLGDLESKISRVALEQGAQTAAIEKQIGALDGRLGLAATQQAATDLAGRVASLEQSLPALQQRVAAQGLGSPALAVLLAATQLRNQLATANPFLNELTALRLTAFNDPPLKQALDQIGNRGRAGIATESWLIGRFSVVQSNIVRAGAWNNFGQRIADIFLDTLSDWAPPLYRLTGVPQGSTPRAITDRAMAWMSAGDFSRAVEQLGELSGKPAEAAVAWLGEARARVIADRARELLAKHMLALAQPGTVTP